MAAFEDGEVAQEDVAAVLEGNRFVGYSGLLCYEAEGVVVGAAAVGEAFAPDESGAGDAEVVEVLAPEEGVVPVVVAVVLVGLPGVVGLACIVFAAVVAGIVAGKWGVCGEDGAALHEVEFYGAL